MATAKVSIKKELHQVSIDVNHDGFAIIDCEGVGELVSTKTIAELETVGNVIHNLIHVAYHKGKVDFKKQVRRLFF